MLSILTVFPHIIDRIILFAHPRLNKDIQYQIHNHKFQSYSPLTQLFLVAEVDRILSEAPRINFWSHSYLRHNRYTIEPIMSLSECFTLR